MRFLCWTILCCSFLTLSAQDVYTPSRPDPMLESWRYSYFPELEGLGIRDMTAIPPFELFWFALDSGVMSYDGYNWVHYGHEDGLDGGAVFKIVADEQGKVYAATAKGIYAFDGDKWESLFVIENRLNWVVYSLSVLGNSVWVASDQGVVSISDNRSIVLTSRDRLKSLNEQEFDEVLVIPSEMLLNESFEFFSDIVQIDSGKIWLGVTYVSDESGAVIEIQENDAGQIVSFEKIEGDTNVSLGSEQSFLKLDSDDIWVINKMNKMPPVHLVNGQWSEVPFGSLFNDDEYGENIVATNDGRIWISAIGNLYCMDSNGEVAKYSHLNSEIPQAHIGLFTAGNDIWIYGYQSTVFKVDLSDQQWLTFDHLNFAGSTTDQTEWFLESSGKIVSRKDDNWLSYGSKHGTIDAPVRVFIDGDKVWAVGSHQDVAAASFFDGDGWTIFKFDSISWGLDYRDFAVTDNGDVWLGGCTDVFFEKGQTGGMIFIEDPYGPAPGIKLHPARSNGYDQLNAYGLALTNDGYLWAGGTKLHYFDGIRWFVHPNRDFHDFVNILYTDPDKRLYVGSRQHGLFIKDGNDWLNYNLKNGLNSNKIIAIAEGAQQDEVWVATDREISFFNGSTWLNDVFPRELRLTNEGGDLINHNGDLWINQSPREWKRRVYNEQNPSDEVKSRFRCVKFQHSSHHPNTEISYYNAEVESDGNTFVSWTGKHYFNSIPREALRYTYKLNDAEWSEYSSNTSITFTGLASGKYVIQVRAIDKEGNLDPTPAIASFIVNPPVWREPWFIVLLTVFLIIITYFQGKLFRQRQALVDLNHSLTRVNDDLASKNDEIQNQNKTLSEANQKIEELSKAKVDFFTNITHELKTPLSLIIGPIDKLLKENISRDRQVDFHQVVRRNAVRLQRLINQLLEVRRIEAGHLDLKLSHKDVVDYVRSTLEYFQDQTFTKKITLKFKSDVESLEATFDEDKMEKILFNLVSNAIKHSHDKGEIVVEVSRKALHKDYYVLLVEDWGTGMDEETKSHLFERFATGPEIDEGKVEGSGIGMSFVKELVDVHEGFIEVQSEFNKGTCIHIELPIRLANISATEVSSEISIEVEKLNGYQLGTVSEQFYDDQRPTVLVAEDNADMNFFICEVLWEKYNVISAENGMEALEKLEDNYVDLVISDVMMPEMDGLSLCRKIRELPAVSHTPVVLLTAMGADDKMLKGYEAGADSYIVKPFNPGVLLARANNLLVARERLKESFQQNLNFVPEDVQVSSYDEIFLNKLSEGIKDNLSNSNFDLAKMAEVTNLSYAQFGRKVKQLTGKKPKELVMSYRMTRAKQLLTQQKINVSEIGYMVGYDVPNSFTRAFKGEFGMSPTEYVEQLNN
ncbi:MAG: response regulator [Cyclobacteriaceae bacterium]